MGYFLQDNPNPNTGQFGWPRTKVSGVIGVHTAENNTDFEGADAGAEDVARFIGRRTDYGSYHAIADADSRLKLVHPSYAAWADTTNNAHAMSVSGAMQAARWRELTPARAAALTRNMAYAAAELVQDALAAGLLASPVPARRITPAEAIAGSRAGFYGHGETNPGRRYDPGQNFDWDLFLTTYAAAVNGSAAIAPQGTTTPPKAKDSEMPLSKLIGSKFKARHRLPKGEPYMLSEADDGKSVNLAVNQVGHYLIHCHVRGQGLLPGQRIKARFLVTRGGKASGHHEQDIVGTLDGTFNQPVIFNRPVEAGTVLTVELVSTNTETAYVTGFGADVTTWKA
ncbi:endolysin [Arthrobacter phage Aoka]|nr:endolysin [Arthrobacter phage Aoka]